MVVRNFEIARESSVFMNSSSFNDDNKYSTALAPMVSWDIHGGAAVALSPKFHLGFDMAILFSYGFNGFGSGSSDFLSVSPGMRLRFTFGKAG